MKSVVRQIEQDEGYLIFDESVQQKAWTDVFKLECLKIKHKVNHFALRAKLSIKATQQTYAERQKLKAA